MLAQANDDYVYELFRKLHLSDFWASTLAQFVHGPLTIVMIVLAAFIASRVGTRVIRRSVQGVIARSAFRSETARRATSRAETLGGVAASIVRIVVWTIAVMLVIDKIGINTGPVLAGASIVGVALGFGAQSLIKDFLSGFFVLAEDQYGVGDVVTILDVTGTVEELNLRITRLRSADGTVWFVPNGEIRKVGNAAKDWSRAIVDVSIPAGTDVNRAVAAISDELHASAEGRVWGEDVLDPPEVLGVESLGLDDNVIRVAVRTKPDARARIARDLRARIGARLTRDGLTPVPKAPE